VPGPLPGSGSETGSESGFDGFRTAEDAQAAEDPNGRSPLAPPFTYAPATFADAGAPIFPAGYRVQESPDEARPRPAPFPGVTSATQSPSAAQSTPASPGTRPTEPTVTESLPGRAQAPSAALPAQSGHAAANQIRLFPAEAKAASAPVFRFFPDEPHTAGAKPRASDVPYLQLHNGFILFGVESGLMMVNQQAAHERIMYEKALEDLRQPGRFSSQQLLFPEVLEFPPGDSLFLEEHLDRLQALGFDLESFGGNAFQLRGLPMEVKPDQARRVVHELVEGLLRPERGAVPARGEDFQQRLAKVYSRVTSVKLGDHLDYPQVSALIDGLFATQNPYVSPSGAPIVVRLSMDEIHRKFGLKP
jgi:DNA mismatch repair protein MutL